jgi:type II secretory pathway pseudopilin PulG
MKLFSIFCILFSRKRDGQSLIEVLVAVAIGAILIGAAAGVIVPALGINGRAVQVQAGVTLGKQLLDNVRVWSEGDWHNVLSLATGSLNTYYLTTTHSPFSVSTTSPPAVSLTENTMQTLMASVSTTINFAWNSTNATVGSSTLVIYDPSGNSVTTDPCGNTAGNFPPIQGLSGATQGTALACQLGYRYVFIFSAANAQGVTASSSVSLVVENSTSSLPAVNLSVNNIQAATIPVNTPISYVWNSTNATVGSSTLMIYNSSGNPVASDACGNNTGNFTAIQGTSGTISGSVAPCQLGYRYAVIFSVANAQGVTATSAISFTIQDPQETVAVGTSTYIRYFYLSDVYRSGGSVVTSGGVYDPSTKLVTVVYGLPSGATSSFSTYITRYEDKIYDQTDWFGGPNATGSATSVKNTFATSSGIDFSTTTGSLYLKIPGY